MLHSKVKANEALLSAALEGLELQKQRIEEQISEVRSMLTARGPAARKVGRPATAKPKRTLSASARKKISIAQKRRWADFHKANSAK